ncbi:MAG TPA: GNAT family N-acetyltransferase [Candidatus Nanopelagicales bacterium]|nr:GNAT family N-acetyltransferase [Candidatus Nanopelagicales bacterium]
MSNRISVRPAQGDDLEIVGRICVAAYEAAEQLEDGPNGGYGLVLANAAARYRDALLLVAVRNDEVVGTVTIAPEGSPFREIGQDGEVEFRFLAVAPSAWGGGVGSALIDACHAHAREIGARRLAICVRDNNAGAMAMYGRHGFTRMPERDWQPVPGVRLLALQRAL